MANPCLLHLPLRNDLVGRDRNGIVTATANGPVRFSADGYFAEEATTNYVRNPRGGSTSFWSISNGTRTFNTGVDDPLGLGTSITITANGAGVSHRYSISDLMIFDRPLTDSERANLVAMDEWSFDTIRDDRQSRRSLSMGLSF